MQRRRAMPWLFFKNEATEWRWVHVGSDGRTRAESQVHFPTRLECVADAKSQGFGQDGGSECESGVRWE